MDNLISDDFIDSIMAEIESSKKGRISMAEEGKYITFNLAGEIYGILIMKIKEIVKIMPITPVIQTADYLKGVINLRDQVIPVYKLRSIFELEKIDYTGRTCIIIVETWYELKLKQIGIVVDSVSEVLKINEEDFGKVPEIITRMNIAYVLGMAKIRGKVIILLNIDELLRSLT